MPIILVVDDVEETRDGIEILLRSDGYVVESARSENGAIEMAIRRTPQLVLVNLGRPPDEAVETARRVREQGVPDDAVPIVLFCIEGIAAGENVAVGGNIHIAHPDNFDQLRHFLGLLLAQPSIAALKLPV